MNYTKAQIAEDVLRKLGLLEANSSGSATDVAYIARVYDQASGEWADDGLVYWPNTGLTVAEIPAAVASILCDLLANRVQAAFGTPISVTDMQDMEERILRRLRRHCAHRLSGFTTKVDTF